MTEYKWEMQDFSDDGVHRIYRLICVSLGIHVANEGYLLKMGRNQGGRWNVRRHYYVAEPIAVFKSNTPFEEAAAAAKLILLSLKKSEDT